MKTQFTSFLLCLMIVFTFACKTEQKNADNTSPETYWPVSTPEAEGIDPLVIDSIHREITEGTYGLVDAFLVIRNGKIVVDHSYVQDYDSIMLLFDTTNHQYNYDHTAWHPYYRDTELHTMQSVTKSVTSILFGIALDEGLIPGVDALAMPYFKEYKLDSADARRKAMTLEDLLTMRSGIKWDEANYDEAHNSCLLMELSDDWIQFVLDQPMDTLPGEQFVYNSGVSVLLGKIVREATGKRIDQWAEEKLFGPLDIDYYWKVTPKGEIDTEGGLYLSTHSLAKIGHLVMNKGNWEGQQIVSEAWLDKSLKPSVIFAADSNRGYGYQWWIPRQENGQMKIFAGNGYGGQFLLGVPEEELLVVFNGWQHHGQADKSTFWALERRILPGLK